MDIRQFILPAGIGLSHITVYDQPAPDGTIGGGAHIHMVCSEIYYALEGTGQIEILAHNGLETVELIPHQAVFFRPGVFHRILNPNKNLKILSIMQNGGLAERGDFVMAFPQKILASPAAYSKALRVTNLASALARRDLSLEGYLPLQQAFLKNKEEGQKALHDFYLAARDLMAPKVDGFEWVLKIGAQNEVKDSLDACDFLRAGRIDYLEKARHASIYPLNDPATPGMAGQLHPYALDDSFLVDGRKVA